MNYKIKKILKTQDVEALKLAIEDDIGINDITFADFLEEIHWGDTIDLEFAKLLLNGDIDIEHTGGSGMPPLNILSRYDKHYNVIQLLIEYGVPLDSIDIWDGLTALSEASRFGHNKIVRLLIEKGADVNFVSNSLTSEGYGPTALIEASVNGQKETVQLLIDNGADVNLTNRDGITALMKASTKGQKETIQLLIDNGADVNLANNARSTALIEASANGQKETIQLLIDNGANVNLVNNIGSTALMEASSNGHKETIQFLVENNTDVNLVNNNGATALRFASTFEMLGLLIENGANNKDDMYYLLGKAASTGDLQVVKYLIEKELNINTYIKGNDEFETNTALMLAFENNHAEVKNYLLESGANRKLGIPFSYEIKNKLKIIVENQDIVGIEVLVRDGLNMNDVVLAEVLDIIYSTGNSLDSEFVKIFIEGGVNIVSEYDGENGVGYTEMEHWDEKPRTYYDPSNCLLYAFEFYDRDLIKYLIEKGLPVDSQINVSDGRNCQGVNFSLPLEVAYYHGDIDMMQFLISHGAESGFLCPKITDDLEAIRLMLASGVVTTYAFEWGCEAGFAPGANVGINVIDHPNLDEYLRTEKITIPHLLELIKLFAEYSTDEARSNSLLPIMNSEYLTYNQILELFNLFVGKGFDVSSNGDTLLLAICRDRSRGEISKARLKVQGYLGQPASLDILMIFAAPKWDYQSIPTGEIHLFQLETYIVKKLIELGVDVNAQNDIGMTALMLASWGDKKEITKLLLNAGADIRVEAKVSASDLASTDEMKDMIEEARRHDPKKLVQILTDFTIDTPIKYTTHEWRNRIESKYREDFSCFLKDAVAQVENNKKVLDKLSPNLYQKVYDFIVNKESKVGWSSLEGLTEYMDEDGNNEPFEFEIHQDVIDKGSSYIKFSDRIEQFKNEIEVRGNTLQGIFNTHKKRLGRKYKIKISDNLKNVKFYTDVEYFNYAIDEIFQEIEKYAQEQDNYVVNIDLKKPAPATDYFELHITHVDSMSGRNGKELLERITFEKGDSVIGKYLKNLCEWYIVAKHKDGDFKIDCFNNKEETVTDAEGFTHIMKFYK